MNTETQEVEKKNKPRREASELHDLLCAGHAKVKDGVVFNIDEKLWRAEEFEACMTSMDKMGVPRFDKNEVVYSLWGRACWMARNLAGT